MNFEVAEKKIWQEMAKIYTNLEKELSLLPSPCTSCGFCCHFNAAEHFLYASAIEIMYIFTKYKISNVPKNNEVCPFLKDNKCTIYDKRMLGCRTYYRLHTKEETIKAEEIYEKNLTLIKELHQKYKIEWNYQNCMDAFLEYVSKD